MKRGPDSGHKKGPARSLINAHGMLSPGDYTTLPMRSITTTVNLILLMGLPIRGNYCAVNSTKVPSLAPNFQ